MTNQLEEFIVEKTVKTMFFDSTTFDRKTEDYISVNDLREFFKDKVIIDNDKEIIYVGDEYVNCEEKKTRSPEG